MKSCIVCCWHVYIYFAMVFEGCIELGTIKGFKCDCEKLQWRKNEGKYGIVWSEIGRWRYVGDWEIGGDEDYERGVSR